MMPEKANASMFGVKICDEPWKLTSLKPRSSARMNTMLGRGATFCESHNLARHNKTLKAKKTISIFFNRNIFGLNFHFHLHTQFADFNFIFRFAFRNAKQLLQN